MGRGVQSPEAGRGYFVIGGPGQGAPPARNATVVMVFDVTGYFSNTATLRVLVEEWWWEVRVVRRTVQAVNDALPRADGCLGCHSQPEGV